MTPSQSRLLHLAVALALVVTPAALAEKPFALASLSGVYHFTLVEIAVTSDLPPQTIYCNGYGRIFFDGQGDAEITEGYGLCTNGDPAVLPSSFTYTVAADGAVELTEEGGGTTTHCQLAGKGALLLCDGSGGPGGTPPAERALWMVTAAKL